MDEDLFAGPALDVTAEPAVPRRSAPYTPLTAAPEPAPVRHRAGYAPFAAFLVSAGIDPRTTAGDPAALMAHLRAHHREITAAPELAQAAAVFLGNALVAVRSDAAWHGDEVRGPRISIPPRTAFERLGEATDSQLRLFDDLLHIWSTAVYPPPLEIPRPTPPEPADAYRSPDVAGSAVPDALHTVARALAAHLVRNYAVAAVPGTLPAGRPRRADDVWTVRLEPDSPDAAPLVLTAHREGVSVEAGVLYARDFPRRNSIDSDLHALEQTVLAVVGGRFAERLADPDPGWYDHAMAFPDGSEWGSGGSQMTAHGGERLEAARSRLAALPRGWQPWPLADAGN